MKQGREALWYAARELKANREVALEAVKRRGAAYWHAPVELKAEREVVF